MSTERGSVAGDVPRSEDSDLLAVAMVGITKRFPGVIANENVHFDVRPGEVHALLGENGAGKSTLSNVLTGLYRPDAGTIAIAGQTVQLTSPKDAIELGIGMVHQHFRLVPTFTVAENITLGKTGKLDRRANENRIAALGDEFGLPVDPRAKIWQLSVGQQQRVEILKALDRNAKVLILDEPTAVLTPQEADALFVTLRTMVATGRSIVFISHKLDEVIAISDRVTVLRDGRNVGTVDTVETSQRELALLMVGRDVVFTSDDNAVRPTIDWDRMVLEVVDVFADDDRGHPALTGVDLQVYAGEIVSVVGVAGNGQRELAETITGLRPRKRGVISIDNHWTTGKDPRELISLGVAHVPEDRLHTGLSSSATIEDNLILKSYRHEPFARGPFLRRRAIRRNAETMIKRFGIKAPSSQTSTRLLSGGNVQKVLLAREVGSKPKVLVAASPTRGLDVGAIEMVRAQLLDAARDGLGVLLITEDLDEAIALSDRVCVMYEGRIVGSFVRGQTDITEIGLMMGGNKLGNATRSSAINGDQ
jgi:general nucleoside transport system ATP-binding protein